MEYIICLLAAILTGGCAYCTLDSKVSHKLKFLYAGSNLDKIKIYHILSRKKAISVSTILCFVGAVGGYYLGKNATDVIVILRILIGIFCVTGSACIDYREHRIPNFFPGLLSVSSVILLGSSYFIGHEAASAHITSSVFATVVCGFGLVACTLITKGGIGAGDIKLLCAIALAGGVSIIGYTIFVGMFSSAIFAAIMLLTKNKKVQDFIPFGPFLFLGFMASVFIIFLSR